MANNDHLIHKLMKQKMRPFILTTLVLVFLITIGYKKIEVASTGTKKHCFTCETVPEGTIFCDDFESETPLRDRYFEYDDNGGDFVRTTKAGRNGSAGMRVVWQKEETSA